MTINLLIKTDSDLFLPENDFVIASAVFKINSLIVVVNKC